MADREIRIELLLGARIVDEAGRAAGRIEEFRAERHGDRWVITEYVVGVAGLLERLAAFGIAGRLLNAFGGVRRPWTIPSSALDLSDPRRPRLRGAAAAGGTSQRLTPTPYRG